MCTRKRILYLPNSDISIYLWLQNKITATFPQIEYINDKIFIEFGKVGHFILVLLISIFQELLSLSKASVKIVLHDVNDE